MLIKKISKKEYSDKEIIKKLKVNEYVFEISGNDIMNTEIIYSFDNLSSVIYNDKMEKNIIIEPILSIELRGIDKNGNEAWICFNLKTDIDNLNKLESKPTDISYLLNSNEAFIKKPLEEKSEFLEFDLPQNNNDDIYKNFSSLWILKLEKNEFIIKLCVPNEVFTYFKISI